MVNSLTCTDFYNLLVAQTGQNNQVINTENYITIIQAERACLKFNSNLKRLVNVEKTMHLVVIGDDHMAVAQTCAKYKRSDIDILVASEYRAYKKLYGSLEDFGYNLPACLKLSTINSSVSSSLVCAPVIYLGTCNQAKNLETYEKLQISSIINLSMDKQLNLPAGLDDLTIVLPDEKDSDISQYFSETTEFIKKRVTEDWNGNLFIFCQMGISRSSTVLIAFLISFYKISLLDAVDKLREVRSIVKPNVGFLRQLQQWEKSKLGKVTSLDDLPFYS